jgi:dienelactone hydrolase
VTARFVSVAAVCLLVACSTQAPGGGRGRGGMGPAGRGGPVAVGQRGGRGAPQLSPDVNVRKYRFDETGEMLEYAVFASSKVKKGTKSPLVIALHGRGVGPTSIMRFLTGPAERGGYIVAAPMGYNERGWYGLHDSDRTTPPELRKYSEKDVMNVLSFMRAAFDIDENRIYLMGQSMGGAGALYLAGKHPDIWAAVAAGAPPLRRGQADIAAMRHMPVFLVHGDRDPLVTVEVSRRLASAMQELGMTYEFREIPGGSHPDAISMGAPWIFSFFDRHAKPDTTRSSAIYDAPGGANVAEILFCKPDPPGRVRYPPPCRSSR